MIPSGRQTGRHGSLKVLAAQLVWFSISYCVKRDQAFEIKPPDIDYFLFLLSWLKKTVSGQFVNVVFSNPRFFVFHFFFVSASHVQQGGYRKKGVFECLWLLLYLVSKLWTEMNSSFYKYLSRSNERMDLRFRNDTKHALGGKVFATL